MDLFFSSVYVHFSFSPCIQYCNVSSKLFLKPFEIEASYLVYRLAMTNCIVVLRMGFLVFVFLCIYFCFVVLSIVFIKDISTTV